MKQRAKITWDTNFQLWEVTYSDGVVALGYGKDELGEFIDTVTAWELAHIKEQQEVSG